MSALWSEIPVSPVQGVVVWRASVFGGSARDISEGG